MVVAFDAKRRQPPVAKIHDSSVLAGTNNDPGLIAREAAEMGSRRFV